MKVLFGTGLIVVAAIVALFMIEPFVLNSAATLEREGKTVEEVQLLTDAERYVPWGRNIPGRLDDALLRRAEQELQRDRLDLAAKAFRDAWWRARVRGKGQNDRVMAAGVTVYARAAQRLRDHGKPMLAADWDDSLFAFAVRAPRPEHRQAALVAFNEGLNLRVEAGQPCAALARVQWAKRGLGGVVPGLNPSVEANLVKLCRQQRQKAGR